MESTARPYVLADRYEVGEVIGRGGMADVRAGQDLRLHRPVAVKLLRPELAGEVGVRRRFEDEARAAARLSHPHLVPIYDTGEHEGLPYIVMECLPGRTLADEFAEGPMEEVRACTLAVQVLQALDVAHRAGIIHRDIKPGNVLLTPSGDAKVTDFGIAKAEESRNTTSTGMLLGTPAYVSPERVSGEPASPQSDVYAVGVLLYEALSGTKPFAGDTPIAIIDAIRRGSAPSLRELRPDVSPAVIEVVERAMEPDPQDRFLTAADMIDALRLPSSHRPDDDATVATPVTSHTQVLPVERPAPAGVARPSDWARGRGTALAAAGLALLVVIVLLVALSRPDRPSPRTSPPESPAAEGSLPQPLAEALDDLEDSVQP